MKQGMQDFQTSFLSTCEGKNIDQFWKEFTGKTDQTIATFVPTKTLKGRKNLRWITQEIHRKMNQQDHLYQVQEKIRKRRGPTKIQEGKT